MENKILNGLSSKEMSMLKAGKATVLGKEQCHTMAGDGALWKCCIGNENPQK